MTLLFGTGGIPLTTKKRNIIEGVKRIHELGLDLLELEFVQSVFLNEDQALQLRQVSEANKVALTVHGSYYINLASEDNAIFHASISRIVQAAKIGAIAGARSVTFHPGFKQGKKPDAIYSRVKTGMEKVLAELAAKNIKIRISPELTGKDSQWGDIEDLVRLVKDINKGFGPDRLSFCIDFAHKHARSGGKYNSEAEFREMLGFIKKELGKEYLQDMHIHVSGINYTEKGERNHLTLIGEHQNYLDAGIDVKGIDKYYPELEKKMRTQPADLKWQELLLVLKEFDIGGTVVCESPNLEEDAILLKNFYKKL